MLKNNLTIPIKTIKQANEIIGNLSTPYKMPSFSYSLPAPECNKGSKLRKIKGTVCEKCYAMKGNYVRYAKTVMPSLYRRLNSISNVNWVNAFVFLLQHRKGIRESGVFRWHDSGDLQNEEHLDKIIAVASRTPEIKHWLPTKESALIKNYGKTIPSNLIIRLSGSFVDGKEPNYKHTSTVVTDKDKATCRSFENGGKCGECRQCWDKSVTNVSYLAH